MVERSPLPRDSRLRWNDNAGGARERAVTPESNHEMPTEPPTAAPPPDNAETRSDSYRRRANRRPSPTAAPRLKRAGVAAAAIRHPVRRPHRALRPRAVLHQYFARRVLLPVVLALLLSYLFSLLVRALSRMRVNRPLGAALVLVAGNAAVRLRDFGPRHPGGRLAGEGALWGLQQLQQSLPLRKPMEQVVKASGEIDKLTAPDPVRRETAPSSRYGRTD